MRWLLILSLAACSRKSEESLGLAADRPAAVDVAHLATPEELLHALQLPGAELDKLLGPHGREARSSVKMGDLQLDETYRLDSDGKGTLHLVHDNAHDGVEAVVASGVVYVKPRYGHWTRRRPEGDDVKRLRDNVEGVAGSYVELLSRWLVVKEVARTDKTVRLSLSAAHSASSAPVQSLDYKKWRDTVKVQSLNGEWTLDASSGAPLGGRLEASYSFERSDVKEPITVTLSYEEKAAPLQPIVPPVDAMEPKRARPLLDREQLLDGLKTAH